MDDCLSDLNYAIILFTIAPFMLIVRINTMQNKIENKPHSSCEELSPREFEEQRLRNEANKCLVGTDGSHSFFAKLEKDFVERYVRKGLLEFDRQDKEDKKDKKDKEEDLMFVMEL
jgi:hypothetical protein